MRANLRGLDNQLEVGKFFQKAFPDSRATFDEEFVSEGTVVLEVTWSGTHSGLLDLPGGPVAPTNRPIRLQSCQVLALRNDKVQSLRQYFDIATLLQQLGMLP